MEKSKYIHTYVPHIELKACPICGQHPDLKQKTLAGHNGHGYPGHYTYRYKCEFCGLLRGDEHNDIYDEVPEAAVNRAKQSWNDEVDRIKAFQQANRERQIVNKL